LITCGFLNTAASAGSAVSLPILMMIGLDPVSSNATNRIPVLIGALSATARFHQRKALPWEVALKVSLPVMMGRLIGAGLAEARSFPHIPDIPRGTRVVQTRVRPPHDPGKQGTAAHR
jgi:uncharacterized membrane protein YfcA